MSKTFLKLEGNTDDLLLVNESNSMKSTRLIYLPEDNEEDKEVMDICLTSTNIWMSHPEFDKILHKKIRMTIEILDEED